MIAKEPSESSFTIFGPDHLVALGVTLVLAVYLVVVGRRRGLDSRWALRVRWTMAMLQVANQLVWHGRMVVAGTWELKYSLPLQLCDAAVIVAVVTLLRPGPFRFELTYLWCLAGTLQGLLTPNIDEGFRHYEYWQFFITHSGLVLVALFLAAGCGLRPRKGALVRVWLATNAWALLAGAANLAFGSNYMFLAEPPAGSLLEHMGPHPWYILSGQGVCLLSFWILLLPFRNRTE